MARAPRRRDESKHCYREQVQESDRACRFFANSVQVLCPRRYGILEAGRRHRRRDRGGGCHGCNRPPLEYLLERLDGGRDGVSPGRRSFGLEREETGPSRRRNRGESVTPSMGAPLGNELIIEAWNTVLFEEFERFRDTLTRGLASHGTVAIRRHCPHTLHRVLDVGC